MTTVEKPDAILEGHEHEEGIEEYAKMRAGYTIGWWEAHHYREDEKMLEYLIKDMSIKEGVSPDKMKKVIPWLVKAAEYHNRAEEEGISKDEEERYRQLAEKSLEDYYLEIGELKKISNRQNGGRIIPALAKLVKAKSSRISDYCFGKESFPEKFCGLFERIKQHL